MPKALDSVITNQIQNKLIKPVYILTIAGNDCSDYLIDFNVSFDKQFGSASGSFTLLNSSGEFGDGSSTGIFVGDLVTLKQKFSGSDIEWDTFYGYVDSREIAKSGDNRTIVLSCLDYLSQLKNWDISLKIEAEKYLVENETLVPNFLPAPNQQFAQVFNFANENIAQLPPPILTVRLKEESTLDIENETTYSGFEFDYEDGQVKLGTPFNVANNYDVVAKTYYHYPIGLYVEDILKSIFTIANGYGKYLFDETSSQDVIDNHLTSAFLYEEGVTTDYLTPNAGTTTIAIRHSLAQAYYADQSGYDNTKLYLTSTEGLPDSGEGNINGDIFTWSSIESGNVLAGIPTTGSYALKDHDINAVMKYSASYEQGRVWYLKYSNLITDLDSGDFTVPVGSTISYIDKRYGRIILNAPVDLSEVLTCNVDYSFCTLQATGIELNYISLMSREKENALQAVEDVLKFVAPNYLVRTQGDGKIWSSYVSQKSIADYDLSLIQFLQYIEDTDLYTHTIFYGKNKNPKNILFEPSVSFITTGQSYKAEAVQTELIYDSSFDGWHKFKTTIGDAGKVLSNQYTPILYINGVQVDNRPHPQVRQQVTIITTTTTSTSSGGGGKF